MTFDILEGISERLARVAGSQGRLPRDKSLKPKMRGREK